jgi:4-hydroxy-2-oxoheptanedioate aldolase
MRANRLRELFAARQPAVAGWLSIDSSYSAELMGSCGYDAVVVDLQHAPIYLDKAVPMLQALSATGAVPMARCSANQLFEVNKLLDGGAYGLICPLVNTPEEAADFVAACRYPPTGRRSYGPTRGFLYGGPDYFENANSTIVTLAMMETRQALDNLDVICAVPGLDGVLVGPSDLGISLGCGPSVSWEDAPMRDALESVRAAAGRAKKIAGVVCAQVPFALAMKDQGWDFVVAGTDSALLRASAQAAVAAFRG